MTEQAIVVRNSQIIRSYDEVERVAKAMAASGFFEDAASISKAIVKIMAGAELGFGPFASMQGVNIIKGKPSYNANMMASAVKSSPRYDYRIVELTDTRCSLVFFEDGKEAGKSIFTAQDAQKAGVSNMSKYPRNMLFARAMSNGVRWYCPDVTNGNAIYTPEELGADVDENGDVIIDADSVTITEPVKRTNDEIIEELGFESESNPDPKPASGNRPYDAETLRSRLEEFATGKNANYDASEKQRNLLGALLSEFYQDDDKRHTVQLWLLGAASTKDVDGGMVKTAIDWLAPEKAADGSGSYVINSVSKTELSGVYDAAIKAEGQEPLI